MADDKALEMIPVKERNASKEGNAEGDIKSNAKMPRKSLLNICPMRRIGLVKALEAQICANG